MSTAIPLAPTDPAQRFAAVTAYMRRHVSSAPRARELARFAGLSTDHFVRSFRAAVGRTPKAVQTDLQMQTAKQLVLQGLPLVDVAGRCGFASEYDLNRRFRRVVGVPPVRWARQQLAATVAEVSPC